jgi:hypothetical protein
MLLFKSIHYIFNINISFSDIGFIPIIFSLFILLKSLCLVFNLNAYCYTRIALPLFYYLGSAHSAFTSNSHSISVVYCEIICNCFCSFFVGCATIVQSKVFLKVFYTHFNRM